jgi:hypothetical protein
MTKLSLQVFLLVAILNASSQKSNNGGKEKSPCERNEWETKPTTQLLITRQLACQVTHFSLLQVTMFGDYVLM